MDDRGWLRGSDADVKRHLERTLQRARGAPAHAVLQLKARPAKEDVRTAFLEGTKSFHPARFARRPEDIRRLANEVFLVIKDAYEELTQTSEKPATSNVRGAAAAQAMASRNKPKARIATLRPGTAPRTAPKPPPTAEPKLSRTMKHPKFLEAVRLCDEGKYAEATVLFTELSKLEPDDRQIQAHLHFARGGEYLAKGRTKLAVSELKRALLAVPSFAPAKKAMARLVAGRLGRK